MATNGHKTIDELIADLRGPAGPPLTPANNEIAKSIASMAISEDALAPLRNLDIKGIPGLPATAPTKPPGPIYTMPPDRELANQISHPAVIAVLGQRGSGKTALILRLQELLRGRAPPYGVGLPPKAHRLLQEWYGLADDYTGVPPNATIYIAESYRTYHARATATAQGRTIGDLVNLSRHRGHTLFFDVQNSAHLDRNIISEVDLILIKEPGPFTRGFERAQLRPYMDAARTAFADLSPRKRKSAVWVVAPALGINGRLMFNVLPTRWSTAISRIFSQAGPNSNHKAKQEPSPAIVRRGKKPPREARDKEVLKLHKAGYSLRETGQVVGLSATHVKRILDRSKV